MTAGRQQQIEQWLLNLLPADGSAVGNGKLREQLAGVAELTGGTCSEAQFLAAREALVAAGLAAKGRGRGGSTARLSVGEPAQPVHPERPNFELDGGAAPNELPFDEPRSKRAPATPRNTGPAGQPQVLSYRHADKRKNNPEVGLVNTQSDPEQPRKVWAYDPHLDPALQFDSARARTEGLIDGALAAGTPEAMRAALQALKAQSAPYLQWAGKAERTAFEIDTVSLHVHERIDPMSILAAVGKGRAAAAGADAADAASAASAGRSGKTKGPRGVQPGLFEAPFENLPLRDAVDFYRHDKGWSNRLVAGDSLLVMNSLLVKEGLAGQVQMIYVDPPYGIKYGSNFQPFVGKRDVKDRADADLTQEPEMIKAFRDTWELGIHSYLTYLRDRLLLARELLSETGSVFVQISDENVHLVRNVLDEVMGVQCFVAELLVKKKGSQKGTLVDPVNDYVIWYGKSPRESAKLKFRALYTARELDFETLDEFSTIELADGRTMPVRSARNPNGKRIDYRQEPDKLFADFHDARIYRPWPITNGGLRPNQNDSIDFLGKLYPAPAGRCWSYRSRPDERGRIPMQSVARAGRLVSGRTALDGKRYLDDFAFKSQSNWWDGLGGASSPIYVVQTSERIIERCLLMTTDPGDLVLDPTCGSGTTAFVAEKWGRRWITCDTSRVAVTLAKTRLMTASFDYFELRYPNEGLKGGFIYKTVPHVTLKSIANNPEIDVLYERHHPAIASTLAALNAALRQYPPAEPFTVTEGVRKGSRVALGKAKGAEAELLEWEVPFPVDDSGSNGAFPAGWPAALAEPFAAFHTARRTMQTAMDRSIAAHADTETLYDRPEAAKNKLRITGPFSVEAVPFPTVLSLQEPGAADEAASPEFTADAAVARSGATSRHATWRDELLKTGIRGRAGQLLKFTSLATLAGTACLHASGTLDSGEPAVLSFGPEHGALEQRQVEQAIEEAGALFPRPKFIVFCAFAFDPEAAKDIDAFKGITALKAQMNTDLLTEDLKKARASNQSFWLMGQPDVLLRRADAGGGERSSFQVEVNGFDYFDTVRGELVSGGKAKIAMWSLDTDYDGRSLFPHQVFFPMAGKGEGWEKLKKDIRAELDETRLAAFQGTVSLPFGAGSHGRVAVKIVDDRGIESLKVLVLPVAGVAAPPNP